MKKTKWKKFALCFVAIFMSLSLACGLFFVFDQLPSNAPEQQEPEQDESSKKSWNDFSATKLNGVGTKNNPWKISSADDLAFLSSSLGKLKEENVTSRDCVVSALSGEDIETVVAQAKQEKSVKVSEFGKEDDYLGERNYFQLSNDIDMSKYNWDPIPDLNGVIDGSGHTINLGNRTFEDEDILANPNAYINDGNIGIALFSGAHTSFENFVVEGKIEIGQINTDSFAQKSSDDQVQSLENHDGEYKTLNSYFVQEIGKSEYCRNIIVNVDFSTSASVFDRTGVTFGSVAAVNYGEISLCVSSGKINLQRSNSTVGGICGVNNNGIILDCQNYTNIDAPSSNSNHNVIGGICGKWEDGSERDLIAGTSREGGRLPKLENEMIVRCVNFGKISFSRTILGTYDFNFGGIIGSIEGYEFPVLVSSCVNFGKITGSGSGNYGGIIGYLKSNYGHENGENPNLGGMKDCVNYGQISSSGGGLIGRVEVDKVWFSVWSDSIGILSGINHYSNIQSIGTNGSGKNVETPNGNFYGSFESNIYYNYLMDATDLIKSLGLYNLDRGDVRLFVPYTALSVVNVDIKLKLRKDEIGVSGEDDCIKSLWNDYASNESGLTKEQFKNILNTIFDGKFLFYNYNYNEMICLRGYQQTFMLEGNTIDVSDTSFNYNYMLNNSRMKVSGDDNLQTNKSDYSLSLGVMCCGRYVFDEPSNAIKCPEMTLTLDFTEDGQIIFNPREAMIETQNVKQYYYFDNGSNRYYYEQDDGAGTVLIQNQGDKVTEETREENIPCQVKDGETLKFVITPNLGYAVRYVRVTYDDNPPNGNIGDFGDNIFNNLYPILDSNHNENVSGLSNVNRGKNPSNNNSVYLGQIKFDLTINKNNLKDLQNVRIYVFYIKLIYNVTIPTVTENKVIGIDNNVDSESILDNIVLRNYLITHEDHTKITATISGNNLKPDPLYDGKDLLNFTDVSGDTFGVLEDRLINADYSVVKYFDIIGKFVTNIDVDEFTITLTSEKIECSFDMTVKDMCFTWDDLEVREDTFAGETTPVGYSGSDESKGLYTYGESDEFGTDISDKPGYKHTLSYKLDWESEAKTFDESEDNTASFIDRIWEHVLEMSWVYDRLVNAAKVGNSLYFAVDDVIRKIEFVTDHQLQQYQLSCTKVGLGSVYVTNYVNNTSSRVNASENGFVQSIYYNTPIVLESAPNTNYIFGGYFLSTSDGEKLLSKDPEYHFVLSGDDFQEDAKIQIVVKFVAYSALAVGTQPIYQDGVYKIESADNLVWVARANARNEDFEGKILQLQNDIDMKDCENFTPIGILERPFKGVFDGNFKQIYNLRISNSADISNDLLSFRGLFGCTDGATIKNITFVEGNVTGYSDVGVVVGFAKNTTFSRVENYSTNLSATEMQYFNVNENEREETFDRLAFVDGEDKIEVVDHVAQFDIPSQFEARVNFGGLVGRTESCNFVGCSNRATVTGIDKVGGIAGSGNGTKIDQSYNKGTLRVISGTSNQIIAGENTLSDCFFGDISVLWNDSLQTNGVFGATEETLIKNSKIWTIVNGNLALKIFYW